LRQLTTQNIDNLHRAAGQRHLAEIHGNARLLRCIGCSQRFAVEAIPIALDNLPPQCPTCAGILKSDTVHFGEPIPAEVLDVCFQAAQQADCMLVAGTSALVYPAASLPQMVKQRGGVLIEVNLNDTPLTSLADCVLRGPFGEILPTLVQQVHAKLTA
jgi:NAD-dependent deacetylase